MCAIYNKEENTEKSADCNGVLQFAESFSEQSNDANDQRAQ